MRKRTQSILKIIFVLTAAALMIPAAVCAGESDRMPSLPECEYSLTVSFRKTDPPVAIDGASLTICKAADLSVNGGSAEYTPAGAYASVIEEGLFSGMSASESVNAAKRLAEISATPAGSAVTDAEGRAVFQDLDPGIYLVTETGKTGTAEKYEGFDPFLVSVPKAEKSEAGNIWRAEVTAEPKTSVKALPTPTPEPESGGSPKVSGVKTGDERDASLHLLIVLVSAAVIRILFRKEEESWKN